MPRLTIYPGTPQARQISLRDGPNTIGRSTSNSCTIEDLSVSGAHCELIVSNGTIRIRDLGSTNGTFIDGAPVAEAEIQPGQRIQLGSVDLALEPDGASVATFPVLAEAIPIPPRIGQTPAQSPGRLRISLGGHAVPSVESPPAGVDAAEAEVLSPESPPLLDAPTNAPCKYHPRALAHWGCPKCHKHYCDLCVSTRPGAEAGKKFCRTCGTACAPLRVAYEAPEERTFFRELPKAVIYPFRGTGIMILIAATLLFAALDVISAGIMGLLMKMVALGYLFSYVQNIIHATAADEDKLPELPGMDDVFGGFWRLIGTVFMSFGPALVLAFLAIFQGQPQLGIAIIPAVIFGCLYFPMAFLAVAMKDNVMASNPLVVVPSILRVPLEYIVTVILITGVFAVRWFGDLISAGMAGESLMTTSISKMFLLFGLRAAWAFVSVYLLTVTMRILGLLYLTKRDRLGW